MNRKPLTYQLLSPALLWTYTGQETPGVADFEGWRLRDVYAPPGLPTKYGKHGSYQMGIERDLEGGDNALQIEYAAIDLVSRVKRVWPYVMGSFVKRPPTGMVVSVLALPKGWSSNLDSLQQELSQGRYGTGRRLEISPIGETKHHSEAAWWPLERFVRALANEPRLNDIERELVDLHRSASASSSGRAYSAILSIALEIAYELVPGSSKDQKDRHVESELNGSLAHRLSELWHIANGRRHTRHAVTRKPTLALHPPMSTEEHEQYARDVDAVIRHVICTRLQIESIVSRR